MTQDWSELLPPDIAAKQLTWERAQRMLRMRRAGMAFREIGRREGVSGTRVMQLAAKYHGSSPLQRWLRCPRDVTALAMGGFRGWTGRGLY